MSGFTYVTTLSVGAAEFYTGVVDLDIAWMNGTAMLYSASGPDGGMRAYSISTGGSVSLSDEQIYGANSFDTAPVQMELLDLNGTAILVPTGINPQGITGYGLAANGAISSGISLSSSGTGTDNYPASVASIVIGGETYVFGSHAGSDLIHTYLLASNGTLTDQTTGQSGTGYQGIAIPDMGSVVIAGTSYLLTISAVDNTITSYEIETNGGLSQRAVLGADQGLGISAPTALVTAVVDGITYAVIAGAGSSSLSVAEITPAGGLIPVDHILDDLSSRFQACASLEIVEIGARVFILAGGADDGVSMFELMPGGQLLGMDSFADTAQSALANVTALAAETVGTTLQVFASSESEAGITQLSMNMSNMGTPIIGTSSANSLSGTSAHDLIMGGAGNDTISGGNGDDILVDGAGIDRLTGGNGADTFVLDADGQNDYILDFDAGVDRLDLSGFLMFYGVDQLAITSTSSGAELRFRDEVIYVTSASGNSLSSYHFGLTSVVSVNRPPMLAAEAGQSISGTSGADNQVGAGGNDTLMGSAGADTLDGQGGEDIADYSSSTGAITISLTGSTASGGYAAGDVLSGIEGIIGSIFGDHITGSGAYETLQGGAGNDTISGQSGDDTITGGSGNDHLMGDAGNDTILGDSGADLIGGGDGDDSLTGGDGADTIFGESGYDTIYSGLHDDFVLGGIGDDFISGEEGADRLTGGQHNDTIYGGAGDDLLIGHIGNDLLYGGAGNDTLSGGRYNDVLEGGDGNDRLIGHNGHDTLSGGAGDDALFGGYGSDVFIFGSGDGRDRVQDFQAGIDTLMLDDALWGGGLSAAGVIDAFAVERHGNVSFVFGGGQVFTIADVADASSLETDLVIF
ncbi:MAG: calcium-binding protein [Paracoccaceae bacterium]